MDSDTPSTERGLLMLRLSLILTTSPTVMVTDLDTPDTSDMDTLDMPDPDTGDTTSASRLYQDLSVQYVIRSLNKGYFGLRILSKPDIQDIYCNILHKYIPLITDQYSMCLKCNS